MKLRIHDNSIRLRLTRSEVARFNTEGRLEAALQFGPDASERLAYSLEAIPGIADMSVHGSAERLMICVPTSMAREWARSERVGLSANQTLGGQGEVAILVEKEFRRLHGAKFNPDLYPNPLESNLAEHGHEKMKG